MQDVSSEEIEVAGEVGEGGRERRTYSPYERSGRTGIDYDRADPPPRTECTPTGTAVGLPTPPKSGAVSGPTRSNFRRAQTGAKVP